MDESEMKGRGIFDYNYKKQTYNYADTVDTV